MDDQLLDQARVDRSQLSVTSPPETEVRFDDYAHEGRLSMLKPFVGP